MTPQQSKALIAVVEAIRQAVAGSPDGLPEGELYAVLMAQGCTIQQFEGIIAMMVRIGVIYKSGHLLTAKHYAPSGERAA